jgi:uncharacterized protein (TIGR02996 family)
MNERAALLRAVCENPDDDTPRLVFADWLDEHDEPERAEFIRLQCEVARLQTDDAQLGGLSRRASELQKQFGKQWLDQLPTPRSANVRWVAAAPNGWLDGKTFDRGFACQLFAQTAAGLAKHADVLFSATPVRRLLIWHIKRGDKLAKISQLRHLHTIRIRVFSKQAADDILECPYLDSVPDIRFSFTALSESHIERLRQKFGDRLRHQP